MLEICLVFWKSEPQYAYKRYDYIKKHGNLINGKLFRNAVLLTIFVKQKIHCKCSIHIN